MSGRGKNKAKISISKPDLPPFLQRMKEQIVANEDAERKERSERKRKDRPGRSEDLDDDATVVKLNDDDLTQEEYKKMKREMETQYRLDSEKAKAKPSELDMDSLIQTIQKDKTIKADTKAHATPSSYSRDTNRANDKQKSPAVGKKSSKKLSYDSSDEDDDD